jgi:hypothetical protein
VGLFSLLFSNSNENNIEYFLLVRLVNKMELNNKKSYLSVCVKLDYLTLNYYDDLVSIRSEIEKIKCYYLRYNYNNEVMNILTKKSCTELSVRATILSCKYYNDLISLHYNVDNVDNVDINSLKLRKGTEFKINGRKWRESDLTELRQQIHTDIKNIIDL